MVIFLNLDLIVSDYSSYIYIYIKDITSVKIKYEEGFANVLGHIFTKPEQMWTKADKALVIPTGKINKDRIDLHVHNSKYK